MNSTAFWGQVLRKEITISWVGSKASHQVLTLATSECLALPQALPTGEKAQREGWHRGGAKVFTEHSFRWKTILVLGGLIGRNELSVASPLEIVVKSLSQRDATWKLKLLELLVTSITFAAPEIQRREQSWQGCSWDPYTFIGGARCPPPGWGHVRTSGVHTRTLFAVELISRAWRLSSFCELLFH